MRREGHSVFAARCGQQLALTLASAVRTAAYYDSGNAVMKQVCSTLLSYIAEADEEDGTVAVSVHSHCVFVDTIRIPTSVSTYERFGFLIQLFESWKMTSLVFHVGLSEDELMKALMILGRTTPTNAQDLASMLGVQGVHRIEVEESSAEAERTGQEGGPFEITPVMVYSAAMQLTAEINRAGGTIEAGMVRRARHVTQAVVDQILRDPSALLVLTTIKDFDRYLIFHATNVAVISTILGGRLGLSKAALGELCLAGFLHDAGKLGVRPDVLQKPGSLDPQEWEEMQRHPVLAAHALLYRPRLTASNMRAVVVAFEHHLNNDLSGYPTTEVKRSVSLFGQIVTLADRYDALTTARVYRRVNITPPEAMLMLLEKSGTHFDPGLMKLFVQMMGLYPPGTVVRLTGGEEGIVCRPPLPGRPIDRPLVRVLTGEEIGVVRDLAARTDGGYERTVLAVLNPSNMGQMPAVDPAVLTL